MAAEAAQGGGSEKLIMEFGFENQICFEFRKLP